MKRILSSVYQGESANNSLSRLKQNDALTFSCELITEVRNLLTLKRQNTNSVFKLLLLVK